ncbi:MAG: DNRLRE domain-containing protein [Clostridiales Family XIII bacterium]|jgi:hypothetical protein|nr:DNRLRE domain-containing protein [Clostridiales Family XIII bacterium]
MRKFISTAPRLGLGLGLALALVLALAACGGKGGGDEGNGHEPSASEAAGAASAVTEDWAVPDNAFTAWYSEDEPEDSTGVSVDSETVRIGKTADGKDVFSLLRLPLKGTWLAAEVSEARLWLKPEGGGAAPEAVRVSFASQPWSFSLTTRAEARALVETGSMSSQPVQKEKDGWVSVPVTDYVRVLLSGEHPNYGFALFGETEGETAAFASGWAEDAASRPYLRVTGAAGERDLGHGKFAYAETPLPGAGIEEGGNCMSYALRDLDMILIDDLGADFDEMNRVYAESGEDGVADYTAKLVEDYVGAHEDALGISDFRRLDGFDAGIDPSAEYRVALRVGCKVYEEAPDLGGKGNFDFHFWAQLDDGQWAQKFPLDASEIVPASGPGIPPDKYPWDSALMWTDKAQNYYTSKVTFFAVTKGTEEFTKHKTDPR